VVPAWRAEPWVPPFFFSFFFSFFISFRRSALLYSLTPDPLPSITSVSLTNMRPYTLSHTRLLPYSSEKRERCCSSPTALGLPNALGLSGRSIGLKADWTQSRSGWVAPLKIPPPPFAASRRALNGIPFQNAGLWHPAPAHAQGLAPLPPGS